MEKSGEDKKSPTVIGLEKKDKKKKADFNIDEVEAKIGRFFKTKKGKKILASVVCLVIAIFGAMFIVGGVSRVGEVREELGDKSVEELNTEIGTSAEDLNKKIEERDEEFDRNGVSDKYLELAQEVSDMSTNISKMTNSMYKKSNGVEMPNTLFQKIRVAPALLYGPIILIIDFCVWIFLMVKIGKKKSAKSAN